ncbi:MAG: lysophospholipase [Spirochaetae bacterium HGW-Spirochaetae-10]|nr:MAG: lysophospholipase [Spirochaetae bacterium HGW-Spirochaetae-10]
MLRAVILFIASSLLSASLVAAPQFMQRLANGESLTVVVYGTSLTERGAWPELMQAELHRRYKGRIHLINGAMSGQTSKWGVMNIEDRVIQKRPDVLFIEFAINDAHRRFEIDVDDTRRNFRRMVQRVKKALPECEIILMTMSDAKGEAEYNRQFRLHEYYQAVRDVAAENGLTLIDLFLARLARAGTIGYCPPEATRGEAALIARLSPDPQAARVWADLAQTLGLRARRGRAVNLDPAALLLDMVLTIDKTAGTLAPR